MIESTQKRKDPEVREYAPAHVAAERDPMVQAGRAHPTMMPHAYSLVYFLTAPHACPTLRHTEGEDCSTGGQLSACGFGEEEPARNSAASSRILLRYVSLSFRACCRRTCQIYEGFEARANHTLRSNSAAPEELRRQGIRLWTPACLRWVWLASDLNASSRLNAPAYSFCLNPLFGRL